MKRLLPFLLLAAVSLVASAQVKVDSLNRLILGNASLNPISQTGTQSTPAIGGKLKVTAKSIQMGSGFTVEPGGTLDIQYK